LKAAANVSTFVERNLPTGTAAVECRLDGQNESGQTWGAGLALVWPGGQKLRVNLRGPDGAFGVDSTAGPQRITGHVSTPEALALRIRLDAEKVTAEARNDGEDWQTLASFPRNQFPGEPARVRLGKMHGVEGEDDHSDPGTAGSASFQALRIYGR
jgi:hypothetical protein